MIWHEISQSADPADWATRYPYMFVHVDITFQYLIAVERYVSAAGTRNSCSRIGADSKPHIITVHRC